MRVGRLWLALLSAALPAAGARDQAPDWLTAACATQVTALAGDFDSVILLDNGLIEVASDGTFTTRKRLVTRILTPEGRRHAGARLPYISGGTKVKTFRAWVVRPSGEVAEIDRKRVVDAAVHATALELYGETRMKSIAAENDARPGDVFASEWVVEEKGSLTQRLWPFRASLPVALSSFSVLLAPGWRVESHAFNGAPSEPVVEKRLHTWSMRAVPAVKPEPFAPPETSTLPWIALDLMPPPGGAGGRLSFASWREISQHFTPRYDEAAAWDAAIKAKADELTASATTAWDRLVALCRYAQQVNYISIQLDAVRAGGMIPREARRVFGCNYGDCKDKATLLRALLASQGIVSYPLVVKGGQDLEFRENWPSPMQFNHVVLAIQVGSDVRADAVVEHPDLGRLLVIDPTDEFTPPGLLADAALGRSGLLLAGDRGGLMALPTMRPDSSRLERLVRVKLDSAGNIEGTIEENYHGQASAAARRERGRSSESEFQQRMQRRLGATLPVPTLRRVAVVDSLADARFQLTLEFACPGYGRSMQNTLLIFKPALLKQPGLLSLRKGPRHQPVSIRPLVFSERAEIALPDNWSVDEIPPSMNLAAHFGSFTTTSSLGDRTVVFERRLALSAAVAPAAEYEQVRLFFEKALQAEQTPVVLGKKAARPQP